MIRRIQGALALAGLIVAALAGCGGGVDSGELESKIADDFSNDISDVEVDCPDDISTSSSEDTKVECRGSAPEGAVDGEPHGPLDFPIDVSVSDDGEFRAEVPPDDEVNDVINPSAP